MPSGILLIDKPLGMRSATCVGRLRALLGKGTRVGHAGTLDSTASGLLVLLVGAATRASDYVMMLPKLYRARVRLGTATDTCDYSGRVLYQGDASRVSDGDVDRVLLSFLGWRMQRPPEISALKLGGRPSHRLARAGLDVPLQPRAVFVRSIRRTSALEAGCFDVEVLCGKGTYVRSIARDIGDRLGCGACIESLRRLSTGGFHVDAALSPDRAEVLLREGRLKLQPLSTVSRLFHRVELSGAAEAALLHGLPVPLAEAGRYVPGPVPPDQAFCAEGRGLLSFVDRRDEGDGTMLRPRANVLLQDGAEHPGAARGPILAIGAFDGFHRGHARLLERARALAALLNEDWGAVTFEPHPGVFLGKLDATLFTLRERELVRRVLRVPRLLVLNFDEEVRDLSPDAFWRRLRKTFPVGGVVVGRNFRFGRGQEGTAEALLSLCRDDGLPAEAVELLTCGGLRLSSTEVRRAVMEGDAALAEKVLGFPWFFWGTVVHGDRRGHELGFPTANVDLSKALTRPGAGVYAALIPIDGRWHCGALSVGENPTFGDVPEMRAEVFVLDFEGDLYGRELPVFLIRRLRPMVRFPDAQALAAQIAQDVDRCREAGREELAGHASLYAAFAESLTAMEAEDAFEPRTWRLVQC